MSGQVQCDQKDHRGVQCVLGARHTSKCAYGTWKPTTGQMELLRELLVAGQKEAFGGGGPAAKSLEERGLLIRKFVGQRWWRLILTLRGREVAVYLPE